MDNEVYNVIEQRPANTVTLNSAIAEGKWIGYATKHSVALLVTQTIEGQRFTDQRCGFAYASKLIRAGVSSTDDYKLVFSSISMQASAQQALNAGRQLCAADHLHALLKILYQRCVEKEDTANNDL